MIQPLFLAALTLAALPALTQSAPRSAPRNPAPSASSSGPNTRLLEVVNADSTQVTYAPGGGRIFVLYGRVHLKEGNTHFYADRITYNEGTRQGEAVRDPRLKDVSIGNPIVKDETHTLTADKMTLDFSFREPGRKVVSAVGSVKFVAKPDPAQKAAPTEKKDQILPRKIKEETVLTCERLDYYYRTKRAVAEKNLRVVQGKRWLTGNQAIYYKAYETVVVNGNVLGEDEKGRTFAAEHLKVELNGDEETIQASKFKGTFMLEDEESPASPGAESAADRPPVFPGSDELSPGSSPAEAAPSPAQ